MTTAIEKKEFRNLIVYSFGKAISLFGTTIFQFALGFYVLKQTGSALSFAVSLLIGTLPIIFINPIAGVIADKFNKKWLTSSMELLNGVLFIVVYVISINNGFQLLLIYTAIFVMTILSTFYMIALEAAKPNIVSEKKLLNINSISKIIDSVSTIIGPMVGGIVFVIFEIETFLLINAVCFILSGLLMIAMDFHLFERIADKNDKIAQLLLLKEFKLGIAYFFNHKKVMNLFTILIVVNFFLGFTITVPLPFILNTVLNLDSMEFGMIQAAFPVGMIGGAIVVKKVMDRFSYASLLAYNSYALSVLIVFSGVPVLLKSLEVHLFSHLFFYLPLMFFIGVIVAFIDIPLSYFVQNEIPDEYRGRVLGIGISLGKILLPIAMMIAGILLNYIPSFVLPLVGGILYFIIQIKYFKKIGKELQTDKVLEASEIIQKSANN